MTPTFPSGTPRVPASPRLRRRQVLAGGLGLLAVPLAGCGFSPSSGGPPFEFHEVDDGPVFGPGLQDELELEFYAALVADEGATDAFDVDRLPPDAHSFLRATDFDTQYLAVVQVSSVNPSMVFDVADVAEGGSNTTVVANLDDRTPHSEDRVISTLLVRVTAQGGFDPEGVNVEFHLNDRHETFGGERITPTA
jgi:hypothetical protein